MLNRNIYILFPAGFSGTYISWCLHKSEKELSNSTVDNPVNNVSNVKYGGAGTSHLHHRDPTHAGIEPIMWWMLKHKPVDKKIYLINLLDKWWLFKTIHHIMCFDEDALIIQLCSDHDNYHDVGNINAITKWPVFFETMGYFDTYKVNFYKKDLSLHTRNQLVENYDDFFRSPRKMNFEGTQEELDAPYPTTHFKNLRKGYNRWFKARNNVSPHEVNEDIFTAPSDLPKNFYTIDLKDVYTENLPNVLEQIFNTVDSGDFNFDYVKSFHQTYVDAQAHLKYIEEIENFKKTGIPTDYLKSHVILEVLAIKTMLPYLPADYEWETKTIDEISLDFRLLNNK